MGEEGPEKREGNFVCQGKGEGKLEAARSLRGQSNPLPLPRRNKKEARALHHCGCLSEPNKRTCTLTFTPFPPGPLIFFHEIATRFLPIHCTQRVHNTATHTAPYPKVPRQIAFPLTHLTPSIPSLGFSRSARHVSLLPPSFYPVSSSLTFERHPPPLHNQIRLKWANPAGHAVCARGAPRTFNFIPLQRGDRTLVALACTPQIPASLLKQEPRCHQKPFSFIPSNGVPPHPRAPKYIKCPFVGHSSDIDHPVQGPTPGYAAHPAPNIPKQNVNLTHARDEKACKFPGRLLIPDRSPDSSRALTWVGSRPSPSDQSSFSSPLRRRSPLGNF